MATNRLRIGTDDPVPSVPPGASAMASFHGDLFERSQMVRLVLYWTHLPGTGAPSRSGASPISCNASVRWFLLPGEDADTIAC